MPLIDVIYSEGSLSPQAQEQLVTSLWATALQWEGIERTPEAASIAWVYLDERPKHRIGVGGHLMTQNIYRINVRVMVGFMDQPRRDGMHRAMTDAVVAADGTAGDGSGPRVFCIIEEIPNGNWSVDGKTWPAVPTAEALGVDKPRVAAIARAIAENPRIDVALTGHR